MFPYEMKKCSELIEKNIHAEDYLLKKTEAIYCLKDKKKRIHFLRFCESHFSQCNTKCVYIQDLI